ncbi:MAG: tetratricopeptide repeat protein [Rhodospirillales bacterium]|nr:tetratricopeptide repeat protein [Rhodospirillales bacterium]
MILKGYTDPRVLRRFIILMALLTVGGFTFWAVTGSYVQAPEGDYEVRQGDILFGDGEYDTALERFNMALKKSPDHRGALMGRALVFLQSERYTEAESEFTYLIKFLETNLESDDITGVAVHAAAYANRGTMYNRMGCRLGGTSAHFEKAFADYVRALQIDEPAIDGPNIIEKVIYGTPRPSTIRLRAVYMQKQLAMPESERLFCVPEKDSEQRMYKPY